MRSTLHQDGCEHYVWTGVWATSGHHRTLRLDYLGSGARGRFSACPLVARSGDDPRVARPRRAAVVARALARARRRKVAERDAAILAHAVTDTDLDSLAEYAAATAMDDLD